AARPREPEQFHRLDPGDSHARAPLGRGCNSRQYLRQDFHRSGRTAFRGRAFGQSRADRQSGISLVAAAAPARLAVAWTDRARRPAGRRMALLTDAAKQRTMELGEPVLHPVGLRVPIAQTTKSFCGTKYRS